MYKQEIFPTKPLDLKLNNWKKKNEHKIKIGALYT